MSHRYWIAAIAGGLCFAFQALAQEQPAEQPIEPSSAQEQSTEEPAIETEPAIPEVAPTEPTRSEHDGDGAENGSENPANGDQIGWYGDTPAQWLMAATGIGALVISAWAVWLLHATLKATRKMIGEAEKTTTAAEAAVTETRRIGEAQVRAYVTIDRIDFECAAGATEAWIRVACKNTGQTPAHKVEIEVTFQSMWGRQPLRRVIDTKLIEIAASNVETVPLKVD